MGEENDEDDNDSEGEVNDTEYINQDSGCLPVYFFSYANKYLAL